MPHQGPASAVPQSHTLWQVTGGAGTTAGTGLLQSRGQKRPPQTRGQNLQQLPQRAPGRCAGHLSEPRRGKQTKAVVRGHVSGFRPHHCHPHHCHTALPQRRLWQGRWKAETSGLPFTLSSTRPLGPPMPSVPVGLRNGQGDTKVSQMAQHPRGNRSIPWDGWGEVRPDPVLLNFPGAVLFGVQKALF